MGRGFLLWLALGGLVAATLAAAALSPLLAWRQPVYIAAGFAGIIGLCLMLFQPLLAAGLLPGLERPTARRVHRGVGLILIFFVIAHVAGLWITSPPDVIDALTFTAPTLFSPFGVVAMWALFATAALAAMRRRLRYRSWRRGHAALGLVIVLGTIVHVALIEGTMEPVTKALTCAALIAATAWAFARERVWARRAPTGRNAA